VAVVVITHQRREELLLAVARLLALPERPHVVVVDNGSTDGTAAAVRERFPAVELIASPVNLGAVGRNVGVSRLTTPYVAFCDDDTWWEPGSLARAGDVFDAHPRLAAATGRIVVEPGGTEDPIVAELRDSPVRGAPWLPGPALGSFLAGATVCAGRRSSRSAASPSGCGWVARRSWWPPTWPPRAGSSATWPS
jgi:GT2 family glycosyltransferase